MPDPVSGVIGAVGVGGSLLSSSNERRAAEDATAAQVDASQAQIDLARETRDLVREDNAPFLDLELQRANAIGEVFGFNPASDGGQQQPQPQPQGVARDFTDIRLGGDNFTTGNSFIDSGDFFSNFSGAGGFPFSAQPFTNGFTGNQGVPTAPPNTSNTTTNAGGGDTNGINTAAQGTALDRFEGSPFGDIFTNSFGLETDAIDAGLAGQGLNLSSVRSNAREDARQRNFGNAFGNYFNALSGFPTSGAATSANNAAASNFGASAGSALGNIGAAQAQGAYATGQANNNLLNGLGGAFGTILGGF